MYKRQQQDNKFEEYLDNWHSEKTKEINELRKENEKKKWEMAELQKERRRKLNEGWKQIIDRSREELKRGDLSEWYRQSLEETIDVYKRQVSSYIEVTLSKYGYFTLKVWLFSVSYTHLDVYKRQV